jgi:TonB family protein
MKKRLLVLLLCMLFVFTARVIANDDLAYLTHSKSFNTNESMLNSNWGTYIDTLKGEIKGSWFPPKYRNEVQVLFKINSKGQYQDLRIINPSSSKEDNQAAIDAIMFASPFKPLPRHINELMVKYTFPGESRQASKNKSSIQVITIN